MTLTTKAECNYSPDGKHSWSDIFVCVEKKCPIVVCEYCGIDAKGEFHELV